MHRTVNAFNATELYTLNGHSYSDRFYHRACVVYYNFKKLKIKLESKFTGPKTNKQRNEKKSAAFIRENY